MHNKYANWWWLKALAVLALLGTSLTGRALAADSANTTVSVSIDTFYQVSATGSANLGVGASNYNTIGEYNFINSGASLKVVSNVPWFVKAKLNQNMPTTPGGGYTLRVDDDRMGGQSTGWSATLSVVNVDLNFAGMGAPINNGDYGLDWRIEGLTEEDGVTPLARTVTFTIYGDGIV